MIPKLLLTTLATHRLTRLIIEDEITEDLREMVFERFPPESTKIGYLLSCPWCVSIWAATFLVVLDLLAPKSTDALKMILSSSSLTGIIESSVL